LNVLDWLGCVLKLLVNPNVSVAPLGSVCFRMITLAHWFRFTLAGAMKSLRAEVNESDERLFR
jgi:hypothetical protein